MTFIGSHQSNVAWRLNLLAFCVGFSAAKCIPRISRAFRAWSPAKEFLQIQTQRIRKMFYYVYNMMLNMICLMWILVTNEHFLFRIFFWLPLFSILSGLSQSFRRSLVVGKCFQSILILEKLILSVWIILKCSISSSKLHKLKQDSPPIWLTHTTDGCSEQAPWNPHQKYY